MKDKIMDIFEGVLYEHHAKEVDSVFSINVSEREIANKVAARIMEQLGECYVEVKATDEKKPPLDPGDSTRELSIDVIARKGSMWYITYWNYVREKWKHHYPDPDFWLDKLTPHPKEEQSCTTCRYLDGDSRQCDKCDDTYCNWEPPHILSKEETDWNKLREQYFEECCEVIYKSYSPISSMKRVAMAPHDLFAWFKKRLSNPLKEETKDSAEETRAIQKQDDKYHLACQNCGTTSQPLQMIPFRNDNHVVGLLTCCSECTDDLYGQRFDRECKFLPDPPTVETKKE